MRKLVPLAAVVAAFAAYPAAAMTPGQMECPAQLAPRNLGPLLTQAMIDYKEGEPQNPEITKGVKLVLEACIKREKVAANQEDAYLKYVIARVSHDDLRRHLGAIKVPTAVLDRVFGLGPGLRNPLPDQIAEDEFNTLVSELKAAGVELDSLPKNAITMMGAYVAITGEMYRAMAAVK